MSLKSKVIVCAQSQLEQELNGWLATAGGISISNMVQSQSFNKLPSSNPKPGLFVQALTGAPQASVTLTILYTGSDDTESTEVSDALMADNTEITADSTEITVDSTGARL